MRSLLKILLLLIIAVPAYLIISDKVWDQRAEVRRTTEAGYVIPSKFSRILAVDYQGLLSDYQFLKVATFYGERVQYDQKLSDEDWRYIVQGLHTVTDLDPYFMDAYLFGESLLAWEADRVEEANDFLRKGMRHIDNWRLPFYVGCNYFLFLENHEKGAEYLRKAAVYPESPDFVPTLAARLDYYAGKSKTAILFLQGLLQDTTDPALRQRLEKRKRALQAASKIEEALEHFKQDKGGMPGSLQKLVDSGYLDERPEDPYGGRWGLLENGRVYSTSRFTEQKEKAPEEEK